MADLLQMKFAYTRCWVNKKNDGETRCSPQQDQIPSHGQGVREAGYTVIYTDETYAHTSHAAQKCWQDRRYPFLKLI